MNDLNQFTQQLAQQFEISDSEKIVSDTNFSTLESFDSLTRYSIIAFISDEYNVEIQTSQFSILFTPKKIFEYILEKKKENE